MPRLQSLAKLISAVFHPLLNPALAFFILLFFASGLPLREQLFYYSVAFFFSVVLMLLYIWWLTKRGVVESLDIRVREQRIIPMLVGALSYFLGFVAMWGLGAPPLVQGLMFCYAINTLVVALITYWWKVSVHTTAIAGPLAALLFQFGAILSPLLLLVPLVGWSRVFLQRHTLAQVIVGAAIGLGLTSLQLVLFFS
jgi:membrane-associated phospholipid phosphatase